MACMRSFALNEEPPSLTDEECRYITVQDIVSTRERVISQESCLITLALDDSDKKRVDIELISQEKSNDEKKYRGCCRG